MTDDEPAPGRGCASAGESAPGGTPEPGEDAPTFDAPWQARTFALAVALTDEDDLPWAEFQSRLVAEVDAADPASEDTEGAYYRQWLAALERLLVEDDLLEPGTLADRVAAFEAGDRSAHEFVEGDPHAHADRLPEGHAEGHGHDHERHGHEHHDQERRGHDH